MLMAPWTATLKLVHFKMTTKEAKLFPVRGTKNTTCSDSFGKSNLQKIAPHAKPCHFGKPRLLHKSNCSNTPCIPSNAEASEGNGVP
jgi:hypothetical protein